MPQDSQRSDFKHPQCSVLWNDAIRHERVALAEECVHDGDAPHPHEKKHKTSPPLALASGKTTVESVAVLLMLLVQCDGVSVADSGKQCALRAFNRNRAAFPH